MARKRNFVLLSAAVAAVAVSAGVIQVAMAHGLHHQGRHHHHGARRPDQNGRTATPIKHVVVIFQENVSFDHYFGTYPDAANTDGQTVHGAAAHAGR